MSSAEYSQRVDNGKRQTLFVHVWKIGLIPIVIERLEAEYDSKLQN